MEQLTNSFSYWQIHIGNCSMTIFQLFVFCFFCFSFFVTFFKCEFFSVTVQITFKALLKSARARDKRRNKIFTITVVSVYIWLGDTCFFKPWRSCIACQSTNGCSLCTVTIIVITSQLLWYWFQFLECTSKRSIEKKWYTEGREEESRSEKRKQSKQLLASQY